MMQQYFGDVRALSPPVQFAEGACSGYLINHVSAFSKVPFIYHLPTSRVAPETIFSRKFILLFPLRKLLGKIPFLSKKGLPSPVLPWRYKNPQVLLHSLEISVTGNYNILNILHKPCMALCPRVTHIKQTLFHCLSYRQELMQNKCKYFLQDHKTLGFMAQTGV